MCLTRFAAHVVDTTLSAREQITSRCASPAPKLLAVLVHIFHRSRLGLGAESLLLQVYERLRCELL
jgi:hypothetical protein